MFLRGCVKPCTRCRYRHAPEALSKRSLGVDDGVAEGLANTPSLFVLLFPLFTLYHCLQLRQHPLFYSTAV